MTSDALSPPLDDPIELDQFALATVVYAARADGKILVLKRAEGTALAGHYFLPGGLVDPGEDPWLAVERELLEEIGLVPSAMPLAMVGCYPMFMYGQKMLQLTFACEVQDQVLLSDEHTESLWIEPTDMATFLGPEARAKMSNGNKSFDELLLHISVDLDRYIAGSFSLAGD